ncbi:MAG: ribonuclease HI family protein [Terriglobia bacterium]
MSTHRPAGVVMHIDGASRGNPGPAAYAVVVKAVDGALLAAFSKCLGQATNNVAEYEALLAALGYALRHHHLRLTVVSDSELLVRQIQGSYKVKSAGLQPLHQQARQMIERLESFAIEHVRREHNREADRLVNKALDAAEAGKTSVEPRAAPVVILHAAATHHRGVLELHHSLPLAEGEEVELEIRRKN